MKASLNRFLFPCLLFSMASPFHGQWRPTAGSVKAGSSAEAKDACDNRNERCDEAYVQPYTFSMEWLKRALSLRDTVALRDVLDDPGLDPNLRITKDDGFSMRLLHWAANQDRQRMRTTMTRRLIELGANVNAESVPDRYTPLQFAVMNNDPEVAKLLIDNGADVSKGNGFGYKPLHLAAYTGAHRVSPLLIDAGAGVDALTSDGTTPLQLAVLMYKGLNHVRVARHLIDGGANVDRPMEGEGIRTYPLLVAFSTAQTEGNTFEMVQLLLSKGANTSVVDLAGYGIYHYGVLHNDLSIIMSAYNNNANVNRQTLVTRETPLHLAVAHRRTEIIDQFFMNRNQYGVDLHARAANGKTPFDYAREISDLESDVRDAILAKLNTAWLHSLDDAVQNSDLASLEKAARDGFDMGTTAASGWNLLHTAAYHGQVEIAEFLIEKGVDINALIPGGLGGPLHFAVFQEDAAMVRALVDAGADLTAEAAAGTPLDVARSYNVPQEVIDILDPPATP